MNNEVLMAEIEADLESLLPNETVENDMVYLLQIGYWDYTKEEFYKLQECLISQLKKGEITDVSALLQAYCLLVTFEYHGILIINVDIDELFNIVFENIIITASNSDSRRIMEFENFDIEFGGYRGYSFNYSSDEQRIREFIDKLKTHYSKSSNVIASIDTNDLVKDIMSGNQKLDSLINNLNEKQPVLCYVGFDKLWEILRTTSINEQRRFFGRLRRKYGLNVSGMEDTYLVFEPDLEILKLIVKKYIELLDNAVKDKDNKIPMYKILIELTQSIISKFELKMKKGNELKLIKEQKKS